MWLETIRGSKENKVALEVRKLDFISSALESSH